MSDERDDARLPEPEVLVVGTGAPGRRRRGAVPIAVLAATVAIAGGTYAATRGSDSTIAQGRTVSSVTQVVHGAAAATQQAKSSRFAMTMDMQAAGQTITMTGTGAFDYRDNTGDISMTMPSIGSMEMVMVPGTFYMKMTGALAQGLPGGKPWVRIDIGKLSAASGVDLQSLMDQAQQQNPVDNLRLLTQAGDVRSYGRETVRGVSTTHYGGQVTLADMAKFYKGQLADQLQKLGSQIADQPIPIDVWIDDDGLPRRLTESVSVADVMTMNLSMDLFDFGTKVDVTPPPADQVTDLTTLVTPHA